MRLSDKALKALKGSINKWRKIVNGTGKDFGFDNCPCCKEYYKVLDGLVDSCDGCPIKMKTGLDLCEGTPYHHPLLWKERSQAELNFLISLLPKSERDKPYYKRLVIETKDFREMEQ